LPFKKISNASFLHYYGIVQSKIGFHTTLTIPSLHIENTTLLNFQIWLLLAIKKKKLSIVWGDLKFVFFVQNENERKRTKIKQRNYLENKVPLASASR
jgi:hypothetical protein